MATQTFQQLLVWQKAHQFVLGVYKYTHSFPKTELYVLTSQFKESRYFDRCKYCGRL